MPQKNAGWRVQIKPEHWLFEYAAKLALVWYGGVREPLGTS
jgi:hypothetical protein